MTRRDWLDVRQLLLACLLCAASLLFITYIQPWLLVGLACGGGQ